MSFRKISIPWSQVFSVSTTATLFHPATMWTAASEVKQARAGIEIALFEADLTLCPGYQTANVENDVLGEAAIGTYQSPNGVHYPTEWQDMSAATQGKQMIRFGWLTVNTSSATRNRARVAGFIQTSDS